MRLELASQAYQASLEHHRAALEEDPELAEELAKDLARAWLELELAFFAQQLDQL